MHNLGEASRLNEPPTHSAVVYRTGLLKAVYSMRQGGTLWCYLVARLARSRRAVMMTAYALQAMEHPEMIRLARIIFTYLRVDIPESPGYDERSSDLSHP